MMKRDVPVYLITGFLESGKTQFLDFTIHQSYFQIPDKTLLILCEEGEEEYDEESLKKVNTVIEIIEDPEDFNADTLQMLNKKHHPGRVLVEYNPLWSVDKFYQTDMPRYWDLAQHIVTVGGCQHLPDLYEQYEIFIHGDDPKRGPGNFQPLSG